MDCKDVIGIIGPAIMRGFSRSNSISAWEEPGLCPFGGKPKFQDHIQATKGKVVKKNTLNYDVLDYNKPIHPQMMNQIGKGNRLTTGKVCGVPMTGESNVTFFEALEREKLIAVAGKAALQRQKDKKPIDGDDGLIKTCGRTRNLRR